MMLLNLSQKNANAIFKTYFSIFYHFSELNGMERPQTVVPRCRGYYYGFTAGIIMAPLTGS